MLPLVIRVEDLDTNTSTQVVVSQSPVHLGRNPLNELALKSKFVSQWHGLIRFDESSSQFTDLGSTNGTEIDGRLVGKGEPVTLTPTTDLRIGNLRLHFSRAALEASPVEQKQWTQFGMRAVKFDGPEATPAGQSEDLFELYGAYRSRFFALEQALQRSLTQAPAGERAERVKQLQSRFPALFQEPSFLGLLGSLGLSAPGGGAIEPAVGRGDERGKLTGDLLRQFARSYLPDVRPLQSLEEVQEFLGRLAEVLETFGSAFLELRRGQEQFGKEIAVRTSAIGNPLSRARNAGEVLRYLLDWTAKGSSRPQELMSGFVEVMLHQVALLNGMRGGVRSLLQRLAPEAIEAQLKTAKVQLGPLRFPAGAWPFRTAARWRGFLEQHRSFDEEQQLSSAVFGPEFARAYSTVMSDGASPAGEGQ